MAQRNTQLFQFLTSFDVRIRRLLYAVRYWAKLRQLSGSGARLTNYALSLLVLCYLQSVRDPLLPSVDRMSQLAGVSACLVIDVAFVFSVCFSCM